MIPLALFLLACASVYLGAVGAAFAVLMRLSLRLVAERSGRPERLGVYLDDPVLLFLPVRAALAAVHVLIALALVRLIGLDGVEKALGVVVAAAAFVLVFEHLLPYLIVRRDPERVLDVLLPSFDYLVRAMWPVVAPLRLTLAPRQERDAAPSAGGEEAQPEATTAYLHAGEQEGLIERDDRQLLQSIVDFGDTLVREVMTPRPDIVAIRASATIDDLRAFFREQEYSRIPVYTDSLDTIVGFVFIKDFIRLPDDQPADAAVITMVRPAHVVPETKRVSDLLREFQQQQIQIAIVVDEYGGTAGLVTLEDLLEEIVGEIRDEYDVETEPVVEEEAGVYLVAGKADIEEVTEHLHVRIEGEGFETFGGYILARLGRVPSTGERFDLDDLSVEVVAAERRRLSRLRVRLRPADGGGPAGAAGTVEAA